MKVEGSTASPLTRPVAPSPQDTSSSLAGGTGETPPPVPAPSSGSPLKTSDAGRYLAGSLSLELHFSLAQSYSSTQTQKTADGYQELRQTVQNSLQADYKFDMSFLARLDSTSQKMGGLGTDVLGQFVDAAQGLASMDEKDLQTFVQSAERLFNELSKATGGGDSFSGAKELLKGSVSDFIHMVKGEMDSMKNPQAAFPPADAGSLPPPPPDEANCACHGGGKPGAGSIDFSKLYDEITKQFDDAYGNMLSSLTADAGKTINDNIKTFMEELKKVQDGQKAREENEKSLTTTAGL